MNLGELPFRDMISFNGYCIAGVDPTTNLLCLNMMEFPDEEMKQKIEEKMEGTLSHETIHAILNEVVGLGRSPGLNFFDSFDTNYQVSLPFRVARRTLQISPCQSGHLETNR